MGSESLLPSLFMVMVQVGFAGLNVVSKLAMDAGMSPFVMVAYRQIVASIFLSPFAYFAERRTRTKITKPILFQILLCSIFGATMNQFLYFLGLKHSTPTMACALSNTLPAITFIMAILFRMENVMMRSMAGQAKVLGTALCVGGSMFMTFYQGSLVKMWASGIHWRYAEALTNQSSDSDRNMVLGATLVVGSCVAWAIWFIVQARLCRTFASPYTTTSIMCSMAGVECLIVAACVERRLSSWAVGFVDIRLIASLYLGVVNSGIAFSLMSWCIQRRGPLYVSMFSPLLLVIVAVLGWAIFDEKLYVGTVVGSALIVMGLYSVLWGKGRDVEEENGLTGRVMDEKHQDLRMDENHHV